MHMLLQRLKNLKTAIIYTPTTIGIMVSGGIKYAYPAMLIVAQTVCVTGTHLAALPYCSDILFAGFTTCTAIGHPAHFRPSLTHYQMNST